MIIRRKIFDRIKEVFLKGKIIIIYGARQVGKTTLVKEIIKNFDGKSIYLNCDEPDIRDELTDKTSTELKSFIGNNTLVVIDEAQRIKNIGITLKLLVDNFKDIQIIATGSSSFDLSNSIIEPLTGRKFEFFLYPISINELSGEYNAIEIKRLIEKRIIFGMYPEVITNSDIGESVLKEITKSYLYKDILQFNNIRNHYALEKLLKALALQAGNEVSYTELAQIVGIDKKTIETYIEILEKSFIVYRLNPYSSNRRNELKRMRKIFFWDTGIRNALINNLNSFDIRNDVGTLWENFAINEMIKNSANDGISKNSYFWRNLQKQEIDYIEEINGSLTCYEIKWNKDTSKKPKEFMENYKVENINIINKHNFTDYWV
ncbi:MAG TPA: ATP-binding protein [Spirochaetota bacterium]|jgi:hypothetical protein|nr:MAG: Archaeal ATPase [Spirochaetes bacterium ADurb.Bin133]HNZ26577.1 ATP-binding protein [Spirochaetota bacterium]HPY86937.1 ATP-binding protein [Spirochaetota bacterium]HQB62078.1 ATP-binding protein [Spirochaetota bacterium]